MTGKRMLKYILTEQSNKRIPLLLLSLFMAFPLGIFSQGNVIEPEKPSQYVEVTEEKPKMDFFQGFSLSADLFPLGQKLLSDYGGFEGALKLNLLNTYFPTIELGYGLCDHTDGNTHILYKTSAPYLRAGVDFNLLKDKFQDNRFYIGARYGITSYKFDISGPEMVDPIWGGSEPFSYHDIKTTSHWFEIVAGAQVKIYKGFHMGWTVRYKHEISSSSNNYAKPYYIPGYGTTVSGSAWGASYHLIFDLNWGKKRRRSTNIEIKSQDPLPSAATDSIQSPGSSRTTTP